MDIVFRPWFLKLYKNKLSKNRYGTAELWGNQVQQKNISKRNKK